LKKYSGHNVRVGLKSILFLASLFLVIFVVAGSASAYTADPMDLGVGARSLGMGKAYVGVAEDSETVFVNPAGLGNINTLKLGSMYTSLFNDINYTVVSGAYPMDNDSGTLGAGFINQAVGGINLYSNDGTAEGQASFGTQVFFVSHGVNLSKKWLPSLPGLYGGYTVKYIMESAQGGTTSDMGGSGFAADMALLYKPKGYMSYGLTLQNIIGTPMSYANGYSEPIDSSAKVGTKATILGDILDGSAMFSNDSRLDMALDYDMGISYKIPGTMHFGLEYKPQIGVTYIDRILTFRAGVNQIAAPEGNLNNLTMGVGINYQGVEFNYAYTPSYGNIPETATHFFSLSYIGVPKPEVKIEETKPLISMLPIIAEVLPGDKMLTSDKTILVQGRVNDPKNVLKVEIDGAGVNVSDTGTFEMNVPLERTGKHLIVVKASDNTGRMESKELRVIRLVKFADVADNHWAASPVSKLATAGLIEGYPNGSFQPERALSRAELSTLLMKSRGAELPIVTGKVFKDLPASHWAARYVKGAMDLGLVQGYPDKTFKPNNKINRTEGVVVLTRFGALTTEAKLMESPYPDLTARNWAAPFIAAAKGAGLLEYIGDKDFEPKKELTRAEACEILAKTSYGKARIDSLLDWTAGFEPETRRPVVAEVPGAPTMATKPAMNARIVTAMKDFDDVQDEFWAADPIKYLATANIMGGYPDGSFKPNRIVTRAELSSILVKAKGISVTKGVVAGYTDVPKNSWAAPYIRAAMENGYMTGKKANKFEPNRGATRAEAVAALVKFDNMAVTSDLKRGPFPDMTARDWSSKYVAAAKDAGMLGYLEGQDFEADKSITRAEVAAILAKTQFGQAKIKEIKSAGNYKSEENL
jgi:hypothetical protein